MLLINICIGTSCFLIGYFLNSNTLGKKYEKFLELNKVVESQTNQNKRKINIFITSLSIVLKSYYLTFIQYINKNIIHLENNKYLITYVIRGKIYKIIANFSKGPSKIINILNEKEENITELILPFLGPNYNFHGYKYTPKCFNQQEIIFHFRNEKELKFSHNEIINFA